MSDGNNPYAPMNGHHLSGVSQMNGHPLPGVAQMPLPPHVYRHPLAPMPAHEQLDNFNNMNNIPQMRTPALHRASPETDYFENRPAERGAMNYAHMPPGNRVMINHNDMASPTYSVHASSYLPAPSGMNSPIVNGSAHSSGFAPMLGYALSIPFGYNSMMVPVGNQYYRGGMMPNFRYPPPMYPYPRMAYQPEAMLVPIQRPPAHSPRTIDERASGAEALPEVQPFTNGLEARERPFTNGLEPREMLFTNRLGARDSPFTSRLEARERPFTNSLEARERPSTSRREPRERNVSPTWPQNTNPVTFEELINAIGAISDDDTELERKLVELERRMATMVENKNND